MLFFMCGCWVVLYVLLCVLVSFVCGFDGGCVGVLMWWWVCIWVGLLCVVENWWVILGLVKSVCSL